MSLDALHAGARLGSLVVLSRLGAGGMGVVYQARDEALGRLVAVKVPSRDLIQDPTSRARFEREALVAAAVVHRNVVAVHAVDHVGGWPYLVLEHVPGGSLRTLLKARRQLPWREACTLTRGIAQGLEAVHARGLVHRDLKPENVLLDQEGRPKIADFGLARGQGASVADLTRTGQFVGTPSYIAPEQIDRPQEVGPAADLYALACILFELLEGKPPFPGSSYDVLNKHLTVPPPPVRVDAPPALASLVASLLAKAPGGRPTSAKVVATLTELLAAPVTGAGAGRRSRVVPAIALTSILVGAMAVSVWLRSRPGSPEPTPTPPRVEASARRRPVPTTSATEKPPVKPTSRWPLEEPIEPPAWAEKLLEPLGAPDHPLRLVAARGGYRFAHGVGIVALAATPHGLLAGDAHGRLTLWNPDTGEERWRVEAHDGIPIMAIDGSRRRLVTASHREPAARVWDLSEGAASPLKKIDHGLTEVVSIAVSADGGAALISSQRGEVVWLDLQGDAPRRELVGAGLRPDVALVADGRVAIASDRRGQLLRWDLDAPTQPPSITPVCEVVGPDGNQGVYVVAARSDGKRVLTGEASGLVKRWDDGGLTLVTKHDATIYGLLLSRDGKRALSGDGEGDLRLLALDDPVATTRLPGHTGRVLGLAFLDDGRAASAGSDGTIRQWDLQAGTRHAADLLAAHEVAAMALSQDRAWLAVARQDGDAELWAVDGLRRVAILGGVPTEKTYAVAISPDGDRVLLGTERRARLFKVADRRSFVDLHERFTRAVGFGTEGQAWTTGEHLSIWTSETTRAARLLDGESAIVAFALAGNDLVVGHDDGSVRVWRLPFNLFDGATAGRHVFVPSTDPNKKHKVTLAITPDGRRGAAVVEHGVVRLFDVASGAARDVANTSSFVALSPDGARFASLRDNRVLVVGAYDEAPGSELMVTLASLGDGPSAAVFLGNDELLVGTRRGALLHFRLQP